MSQPPQPQQHYCPRCNAPIATGQTACNICGLPLDAASIAAFRSHQAQQARVQPAYPLPVPARRGASNAGRNLVIGLGAVVGLVLACALVASFAMSDRSSTAGGPTSTAAPAALAPSIAEIAAKKKASTDAQWDAYAKTLEGKRIENWTGKVQSVDQKAFSDKEYDLIIDTESPDPAYSFNLWITLNEADALVVPKDATATASGIIERVDCFLTNCPIHLRNATYSLK